MTITWVMQSAFSHLLLTSTDESVVGFAEFKASIDFLASMTDFTRNFQILVTLVGKFTDAKCKIITWNHFLITQISWSHNYELNKIIVSISTHIFQNVRLHSESKVPSNIKMETIHVTKEDGLLLDDEKRKLHVST